MAAGTGPKIELGSMIGSALRLLALCLVVGLVLSFFDVRPIDIIFDLRGTIEAVSIAVSDFARWATPHIIVGAEIVLPLALLYFLLRRRWH